MARPVPTLQQSQNLLVKLGLLESQSTVPGQTFEFAVSSVEVSGGAGPCLSRAHGTTNAEVTAVVKSAGEARPPDSRSSVPRQIPNPVSQSLLMKSLLMKLSRVVPDQVARPVARPVPSLQQPQSLLVKIGLLRSQSAAPRKVQCRDQRPWTRSLSC